jgi:hypothetical protein
MVYVMNQAIELHDSDLGEVRLSDTGLTIGLAPAYVHRSEGRVGIDPGTGWTQLAELVFTDAVPRAGITASGALDLRLDCITLDDGSLQAPGQQWRNLIPAPLEVEGPLRFVAQTQYGEDLIVEAQHLSVMLIGEATYVEQVP